QRLRLSGRELVSERLAEWRLHGLSTSETDEELVKSTIDQIYQSLGQEAPDYFFCDSPYAYFSEIGQRRVRGINLVDSIQRTLNYDWEDIRDRLFSGLRNGLSSQLIGQIEAHWNEIWGDFGSKLGFELCVEARKEMRETLKNFDGDPAWDQLWAQTFKNLQQSFTGSMSCYWPALYLTAEELGVLFEEKERTVLQYWSGLARSCFFWYPFGTVCFISRRPSRFFFDDAGKANGVLFKDGRSLRWTS
ncbi:MAG: hypothetical protein P1V97_33875, partial [Planctomycetota bacterium]|nr:hypothetical protein [Planctomycetota bacterium]